MSLLEYFFPKFPPLAKDPIPNIRIIKTTRQVIIVIMNRIEDIFFIFKINFELSDFKEPV